MLMIAARILTIILVAIGLIQGALPAFAGGPAPTFEPLRIREEYRGEDEGKSAIWGPQVTVLYITSEVERQNYDLEVRDGLIFGHGVIHQGDKRRWNTDEGYYIEFGGDLDLEWKHGMVVLSPEGRLLGSLVKSEGSFHHSKFLGDMPLAFAGAIKAPDGRLKRISDNSGHFETKLPNLLYFLWWLEERNVDLSEITFGLHRKSMIRYLNDSPTIDARVFRWLPEKILLNLNKISRGEVRAQLKLALKREPRLWKRIVELEPDPYPQAALDFLHGLRGLSPEADAALAKMPRKEVKPSLAERARGLARECRPWLEDLLTRR